MPFQSSGIELSYGVCSVQVERRVAEKQSIKKSEKLYSDVHAGGRTSLLDFYVHQTTTASLYKSSEVLLVPVGAIETYRNLFCQKIVLLATGSLYKQRVLGVNVARVHLYNR